MRPSRHGRAVLTPLASTLALLSAICALSAGPALAQRQSLTISHDGVDPGPVDTGTYGVAAWRSGSISEKASRVPDGRIRLVAHITIVARRAFKAQLYIAACNAGYQGAMVPDPVNTPPVIGYAWGGTEAITYKQLHKGRNDLRYTGIVSSDDRWTEQPTHWTDCAGAGLIDADEDDAAAIKQDPAITNREGRDAFTVLPVVLSLSAYGQHL